MLQRAATRKFRHRRKHFVEFDTDKLQEELDQNAASAARDANTCAIADAAGFPSGSVEVRDAALNELAMEEWAATRIQTAFRGFLVLVPLLYLLAMSNENLKSSFCSKLFGMVCRVS